MPQIGVRLPDYLFEKVHDRRRAVHHTRKCPGCGYKWPTVEVSLVNAWEGGKFNCCQIHTKKVGKAYMNISVSAAKTGKYFSKGLLKIVGWGGYYRRRECPAIVAFDGSEKRACKARWTTAEIPADGVICEDVQKCPRCGSVKSRVVRIYKQRRPQWY